MDFETVVNSYTKLNAFIASESERFELVLDYDFKVYYDRIAKMYIFIDHNEEISFQVYQLAVLSGDFSRMDKNSEDLLNSLFPDSVCCGEAFDTEAYMWFGK